MPATSRGTRVQVFFGESDQIGHAPRYQALLEYLRKEGAAGATVTRGVAGFGANSKIHTAAILRLSTDLPMILTWIDAPGRVERLLPGLKQLAGSGIVTVDEVGIAAYGGRRLEQLRFDLQVRDVMTRPVESIGADANVRQAVEQLIGRDFRALPVVDEAGRPVGIVTSGDLVERGGLNARLELLAAMPSTARISVLSHLDPKMVVREVMTADPATVRDTATLGAATHLMVERRIKRMPVSDAGGYLVGVLSRSDVLRAVGETFPSLVTGGDPHPGARTVADVMRRGAPTVQADADLAGILDAVVSTRLNRAVVIDEHARVLGIVTDADVIRFVDPETGVLAALMRGMDRPVASTITARALLSGPAITVTPEATIATAAQLMIENRRKILCVVDADGALAGIVDRADLLRAAGVALRELAIGSGDDDE